MLILMKKQKNTFKNYYLKSLIMTKKLFTDKMLNNIYSFDTVRIQKPKTGVLILTKADIKLQILKNRFR